MMNARKRREMMETMTQEYGLNMVKALMNTIAHETGSSCTQAADIVITAWNLSHQDGIKIDDCYDEVSNHMHEHAHAVHA